MANWETVRHQVAISGSVTDAVSGRPLPGARITVTLPKGEIACAAAHDGHFHVMDLANGTYGLEASMPKGGYGTATRQVTVSRNPEGRVLMAVADMQLAHAD